MPADLVIIRHVLDRMHFKNSTSEHKSRTSHAGKTAKNVIEKNSPYPACNVIGACMYIDHMEVNSK